MTAEDIRNIIEGQRRYYASGPTLDKGARKEALLTLQRALHAYEERLYDALYRDLGKSRQESLMCEIGLTHHEIRWMLRHIDSLMRRRRHPSPLMHFPSSCYQSPSPYGCVLVISPWNYPVLLNLQPMVDALAAGNTVVLKPSELAPDCAQVIEDMISEYFDPGLVAVVNGGIEENRILLSEKFDFIFFTGGERVGRIVLRAAAEHLTPVVLELGGKSPVIVDDTADINLAARRIAMGKGLNCGQTCVAPDYVLCVTSVHDALIEALKKEFTKMYGENPLNNPDYGKIIGEGHFKRLQSLIDPSNVVYGGQTDPSSLRMAPLIMDGVTPADAVMQEEIFGPILPVLTVDSVREAVDFINSRPHPLALYHFTTSRKSKKLVQRCCRFGGGCINDTMIHTATEMPFGGVGNSGMGAYHGRKGFETFTHMRSIVDKRNWLDLNMRYQPYTKWKECLVKLALKL